MKLLSAQLQAFAEVARVGTVHGAARRLGLTQTAVTQRLQALERDLDASLFTRSRRGMQLTDAGQALVHYCRQAEDLEGEALAEIGGSGEAQVSKVTIEGPSSILRSRVIPAVAGVLSAHPRLTVEFRMSDLTSGTLALKRGLADFVVVARADVASEFDSRLLKPERYILVGPAAWGKRPLAEVVAKERVIDFDPGDRMTQAWLEKHGLLAKARDDRHFVNNTDALAFLVGAGLGYSVLAAEFARPLIEGGALAALGGAKHYDYEVALAWYPRKHPPAFWTALLGAIR